MANTDFDYVIGLVLKSEGGYCNDVDDPGGPTNFGITIHDYSEFKKRKVNAEEVRAMPRSDAITIYKEKYRRGFHFEQVRAGPDYLGLDYGINSGLGRPPLVFAKLLNRPATKSMTPDLIKAVNDADPVKLINAVSAERLHFMKGIRDGVAWRRFGGGWQKRVDSVDAISKHLAAGGTVVAAPTGAIISANDMGKAIHAPDPKVTGKIVKTGTATGTGGGLLGAQHSLLVAGGIIIAVIIIGGVSYYLYKRSVDKAQNTVILPPGMIPLAA